ncbi:MAG: UTRA domain-containing protein, partial [Anaerolineae bacterium]|nr:UTRA domain-containing protein [Anaerolineae bacterium]
RSDSEFMAALAQPEELNLLKLKPPAAVLISDQTTYLENRVVIEVTRSIFNADRYKLQTHS